MKLTTTKKAIFVIAFLLGMYFLYTFIVIPNLK